MTTVAPRGGTAREAIRWTGLVIVVILVVALALVAIGLAFVGGLANTFRDDISEAIPHEVYSYSSSFSLPSPNTEVRADSFQVGTSAKEFQFRLAVTPSSGCASVQLTSPDGRVVDLNGNGCSQYQRESTFTQTGTWSIRYTFVAYTGSVQASAYAFERAE